MRELFLSQLEKILSAAELNGTDSTGLQQWLYREWFCKGPTEPEAVESGSLLDQLSLANTGRDCWDTGWEIAHVDGSGRVLARRLDVTRSFWPGQFLTEEGPELPPRPGMHLRVFFPRESTTMQPGFYFAFGSSPDEDFDGASIVRFYWAVRSSGAVALTGALTAPLNRLRVPFRFKTGVARSAYTRLDAAVLYVHKRYYQVTARLLTPVYGEVRKHLVPRVPLFTKELAPGLGLAEDPGTGESFGMHRCRLLAEAMLAERSGAAAVAGHLERAGVRADRPYVSAGSADLYEFTSTS